MKLQKQTKRTLGGIGIFTYVSGVLLFILSQWVRVDSLVGEQHHPTERLMRITHTSITYIVVLALGYLVSEHIIPGLKATPRKRFPTGLSVCLTFVFLTITAVGILYANTDHLSSIMHYSHSIVGLLCPLLIFIHVGKRSR